MKRVELLAIALLGTSASAAPAPFVLRSTDISPNAQIAKDYVFDALGCKGKNISPELEWSGAPANTKSFALIVHDPDARTGVGGFTHWIVFDIPASTSKLPRAAGANRGRGLVQHASSFGTASWGGPCPPAGDPPHQYTFTLYALSAAKLAIPATASQGYAGFLINQRAIASAQFTAEAARVE
ncbi:YbhB/YbcL family Raf kinase inhibitor-like protein [soil metagenome]